MAKGKRKRQVQLEAKKRRKARMPANDGTGRSRYAKKKRGQIVPSPRTGQVWCGTCYCKMCRCGDAA